ncbi:MAG TPA: hypothetical protein VGX51_11220 [Solirubrobacteraceae bacterium]|jgi:hypothetical protein|nr:hypothetical protein [Solirubrobacteraceae bacterium]
MSALAWPATAAAAPAPVLLDGAGVSLASYGGWAAWSRADASTRMYALVTRSPQGVISPAPVPERSSPFDVELGPVRGSRVGAVYSRCADDATRTGCHLLLLELPSPRAGERALAPAGGGSDYRPAIWRTQVAFLRRGSSAAVPDRIFVWRIGSHAATQLALPRSRGNGAVGWPAGLTGRVTGLTFNGMQVAYVTSNAVATFSETTLWFQSPGRSPELIDQQTGGAGNVCEPAFVSPLLLGKWLYAYLHACDPSANPRLDRLTRYRHGEVQVARFTFVRFGDEAIASAVPDGNGVDWDAGGVTRVAPVWWRTVAAPLPQTLCSRGDLFC